MKRLLLIDTFNFLHRAYHALPSALTDKNGEPVNALYGVTSMLINVFDNLKPDYVVAALDSEKPVFRLEKFTQYKAQRKEMDPQLASQIPKVKEMLEAFLLKSVSVNGYEADDIIATLATKHASKDLEVLIVSNDRDLWQLINKNVKALIPAKGNEDELIDKNEVEIRLGITPEQITDYKALRGDPSDNIPGVSGIGEKTAKKLLAEFGTVENIFINLAKVQPEKLRRKLEESYEIALTSKELATVIRDVPFTLSLDECKYKEFNKGNLEQILQHYNFKSLLKRIGFEPNSANQSKPSQDQLSLL